MGWGAGRVAYCLGTDLWFVLPTALTDLLPLSTSIQEDHSIVGQISFYAAPGSRYAFSKEREDLGMRTLRIALV